MFEIGVIKLNWQVYAYSTTTKVLLVPALIKELFPNSILMVLLIIASWCASMATVAKGFCGLCFSEALQSLTCTSVICFHVKEI